MTNFKILKDENESKVIAVDKIEQIRISGDFCYVDFIFNDRSLSFGLAFLLDNETMRIAFYKNLTYALNSCVCDCINFGDEETLNKLIRENTAVFGVNLECLNLEDLK